MIQGHLSRQNHPGIAPGLAAPTLSMVGFKCHLPGVAGFDLGPPSKQKPSRPFALPEFDKIFKNGNTNLSILQFIYPFFCWLSAL